MQRIILSRNLHPEYYHILNHYHDKISTYSPPRGHSIPSGQPQPRERVLLNVMLSFHSLPLINTVDAFDFLPQFIFR